MTAHVLFSDGTSAELRLELDASQEPKVFVLGSPSRDVLLSAERGASAAYFALRRRGLIQRAYASFFDVVSGDGGAVLGESAGLGFALAFAAHALAAEHPDARPATFAATGVVAGGTGPAEVGAVTAIDAKLRAAADGLPSGATVFVPAANVAELPDATRESLAAKGLGLVPVATVDQAVEALAGAVLVARRPTGRRRIALALAAALAIAVTGWGALRWAATERAERIAREVRTGTFASLAGGATPAWLPVGNAALDGLADDARRDLAVPVVFHSRTAGEAAGEVEGVRALGAGDRYRLTLAPSRDGHLYVVQVDASGNLTVLFPNPAFTRETNPVQGGRRYAVPDDDRWLVLDRQPGTETIVVVAAPWPAEDLDALLARLPSGGSRAPDVVRAIRDRAGLRKAARLEGLRGIAYDEIVFAHR